MPIENSLLSHTFYQPIQIIHLEDMLDTYKHSSSLPCIIIVYDGSISYTLHNQQIELHPRTIMFWDNVSNFYIPNNSGVSGIVIEYRPFRVRASSLFQEVTMIRGCSHKIMSLALAIEKEARAIKKTHPFRLQKLFADLLEALYTELSESIQQKEESWIEIALEYVHLHFHEELTREQMAEKAQVSPEHFSRTFLKHTGHSFTKYLTLLRVRESQKKLLYEMPKLDDLARDVGYREGTYLSRKFKQFVGISPSVYNQKPKRVIALNTNHTACLLALGIIPELGVFSPYIESLKSVPSAHKLKGYEHDVATNYEEIIAACPDVIINYSGEREKKALLSLAPVCELPCMQLSWREQFRLIANIVDKQELVGEWLYQYNEQVAHCNHILNQQLGKRGTAIVWEIGNNAAYCFDSGYGRGSQILYDDLGFSRPNSIIAQSIRESGFFPVEIEELVHFPADHIFITALPTQDFGKKRFMQMLHSEQWRSMEAVRKKQVYFINQYELFYGYDPLSTAAQLEKLMRVLTS
ncbi:ABC transporter substrate-binding protein [Metasolibacillus meyeri]|uniref:ABC transporter substrate-binding protein n=1 Tax=Metasolibacillus meyeri TaxID=1071052 RepID=UPI000D2FEE8B|nr:ABC transporter substrate-binding protein [Metasolibacillus meyeri]